MDTFRKLSIITVMCGALSACHDHHGGSDPEPPVNEAPVASSVSIADDNGGEAEIGDSLTGSYSYSDADNDAEGASSFRWLRDGVAISGATGEAYTLTTTDAETDIIFEVSPKATSGETDGSAATSAAITVNAVPVNQAPVASSVSIVDDNGDEAEVGDSLTGNYSYSDEEGDVEGTSTFRWLRDDSAIDGATTTSYTLTDDDAETAITFEVTPVATAGTDTGNPVISEAIIVNAIPANAPVVNGVARYLDVNNNRVGDAGDLVIIPFDQDVSVNSVSSSDFSLPVAEDTLGTGATFTSGPASNEVTITLGTAPRVEVRQDFSPAVTVVNSASGIDISDSMTANAIEGVSGVDAAPSTVVDVIPAFVDSEQSLDDNFARSVALGDVDGDGDLDMVVANDTSEGNRVLINDGNGIFTNSGQSLNTNSSQFVVLGDIDGDADLDMIVANYNDQANRVYVNDGSGVFTDSNQSLGNSASDFIALGDVDGDGDLDMVVANFNEQGNRVYLNDGSGSFTDSGQSLGANFSSSVALGDLDDDGDLDMVVANNNNEQANLVYLNDGNGVFTVTSQLLGMNLSISAALGDVDGDGNLDMVVANFGIGNQVYLNDGNANFTDSGQSLGTFDSEFVVLRDLDRDGDLDMVVANESAQGNRVYHNDGAGIFTDTNQSLGANNSRSVALGNIDGDLDFDMVVINRGQDHRVYLGSLPTQAGRAPDVWDIAQGSSILNSSGEIGHIANMFGETLASPEPGITIFSDDKPVGFAQFVEWQSATEITLIGYHMLAFRNGDNSPKRGFTAFRLYAFSTDSNSFELIDTYTPASNPIPGDGHLEVSRSFAPVNAQIFRAEFDQNTSNPFAGTRINELDAIISTVPVSASEGVQE